MTDPRLDLTRSQILAFRRHVGALDERLPAGRRSLRRAAWAGLQDSMPRAALLSIHARVEGTRPSTWEDPSLIQLWGPRYSAYVVAARDLPFFSLGRLPDDAKGRRRAEDLAARLHAHLDGARMTYGEAGRRARRPSQPAPVRRPDGHGRDPMGRRAAADDLDRSATRDRPVRRAPRARAPVPARVRPHDAGRVHRWAGIASRQGAAAFDGLRRSTTPVRTPVGDAWILTRDEPIFREAARPAAPARLLPSGDAYYLLQGADRELLVPDARRRPELWTSRVWPGAVLVEGEVVGTWRRADAKVTVQPWRRLSRAARDAVEAEAASLPLPGIEWQIVVRWDGLTRPGSRHWPSPRS